MLSVHDPSCRGAAKSEVEGIGDKKCPRNWKERLRSLPAAPGALVPQSLSVWPQTERTWPSHTRKVPMRLRRSSSRSEADAADADAVEAAVEKTVATFGRLDVLVNNAGTAIPKRFEETTLEELDRLISINVRGALVATQAALKHMQSGGRIIMIGSAVGERAMTPGLVPYSATKGAVKMFTQGLSREVGSRGITVNNIQPGPIDTDLNPAAGDWAAPQKANTALDRYGSVDEVAALVAFVAGPEASYITGANLTVDGGTNA